jgi:hypothetical protein
MSGAVLQQANALAAHIRLSEHTAAAVVVTLPNNPRELIRERRSPRPAWPVSITRSGMEYGYRPVLLEAGRFVCKVTLQPSPSGSEIAGDKR